MWRASSRFMKTILFVFLGFLAILPSLGLQAAGKAAGSVVVSGDGAAALDVADLGSSYSILERSMAAGPLVMAVLLMLVAFSILSWTFALVRWSFLRKVEKYTEDFVANFWESRSLNEFNGRLKDYPYSPVRERFRSGYAELVRANQLKEQTSSPDIAIGAAMDNLNRTLVKVKGQQRRSLEKSLSFLAISASASPFIGLFGTVWGIMNAFEGIARSGSASLAMVAPGISEALIATAFGLAAAIPAVIGYNIANGKIRNMSFQMDGFSADFLNIVERYLVTDRSRTQQAGSSHEAPSTPRI